MEVRFLATAILLLLLVGCGPSVDGSKPEGQLAQVFLEKGGKHHDPQAEFASILDRIEANTMIESRKKASEYVLAAYQIIEMKRPGHTDLLSVALEIERRCPSGQRSQNDLNEIAGDYAASVADGKPPK